MKRQITGILIVVALIGGVVACATPAQFFDSMVVYGAESANTTAIEGNIMAVFYAKADEGALFWVTDAQIIDRGDGTWDVISPQCKAIGVNQALVDYGLYKYKPLPGLGSGNYYLDDLNLQSITWDDLPKSEHIGKLMDVDPLLVKPATVRRRYMGVNYDFQCLVTQAVKDAYQVGAIQLGDYVLVSFIEEIPNETEKQVAIVTDKVYESW